MTMKDGALRCDWRRECTKPVTHIGEKGYVYCESDVSNRHGYERTRRLLVSEVEQLKRGEPLKSFKVTA